jgi:uracil-DNA glycosylase
MDQSWYEKLKPFKHYVVKAIAQAKELNEIVYPPPHKVFDAFKMPFDKVRVIIIGQDPYHGHGQANGLAFSVNKGTEVPRSLSNIYKELNSDLGLSIPNHGDLTQWVDQGVLLLNSSLTVSAGRPASHALFGWQEFTTEVIRVLSEEKESLVFILWGMDAINKTKGIDLAKHYVIKSTHPSFYSADKPTKNIKAFFGSKPFSQCNEYLSYTKKEIINWQIN